MRNVSLDTDVSAQPGRRHKEVDKGGLPNSMAAEEDVENLRKFKKKS